MGYGEGSLRAMRPAQAPDHAGPRCRRAVL